MRAASSATSDVYDWRHYIDLVERKPGALRNGAPFCDAARAAADACSGTCCAMRAATG